MAWLSTHARLGIENAAYYTTAPLRETLSGMIDLEHCAEHAIRLTVGAVNARNGEMRYFDSRDESLRVDHVLASGRAAAGFSGGANRRRPVLGRRDLLEHADRGGARRQAAPRTR
jgi:NTE family protein